MISSLLIALVRLYRCTIGAMLPPMCKYTPSCTIYMIQAIEKYGPVRGTLKGIWRLLRCAPWGRGGYDPP